MKNITFKTIACSFALLICFANISAQTVSKAEALAVATHFFQQRTGRADVQLSLKNLNSTNASNTNQFPSNEVLLFEPTNSTGFVLVSADKNAPAILAFSDYSNFDVEHIPPQAKYMIELYAAQIKDIRKSGYKAEAKVKSDWDALYKGTYHAPESPTSAGPLLTTTWNQGGAYNQFCPQSPSGVRAVTGCVATTMAQIMRYWRFPNGSAYHQVRLVDNDFTDRITPSSPNTDMVTIDSTIWLGGGYNWNNMPNAMTNSSPTDIARLMLHAGFAIGMDYGIGGSGAPTENVPEAMKNHFGYEEADYVERSSMTHSAWHESLRQSLDNSVPLIYRAPGHAWVCDGYSIYFGETFYNMNWGWGGSGNGFYDLNALAVNGNNFNNDQCAIFGLIPPGCPVSNFSTGVALLSIEVAQTITAISTITPLPGFAVTFDAGESVILLPGFEAPLGCTFIALIEGCGGDFFNQEDEIGNRSNELEGQEAQAKNDNMLSGVNIAPNPFSGSTTITYTLPEEQTVAMQLFSLAGQLLATPLAPHIQPAGQHAQPLDLAAFPAGVYLLVISTGGQTRTQQIVRMR